MIHSDHLPARTHGLADGCPRCAEHAKNPLSSLDRENLTDLWTRTVAWTRGEQDARSENEQTAMFNLQRYVVFLRRVGIDPDSVTLNW